MPSYYPCFVSVWVRVLVLVYESWAKVVRHRRMMQYWAERERERERERKEKWHIDREMIASLVQLTPWTLNKKSTVSKEDELSQGISMNSSWLFIVSATAEDSAIYPQTQKKRWGRSDSTGLILVGTDACVCVLCCLYESEWVCMFDVVWCDTIGEPKATTKAKQKQPEKSMTILRTDSLSIY